uniref:LFNG O-fucosylpeptide 3-beta-N-acetylglucosaminyltransferase n=1 Tax=Marmota marmota marmota TaxID=9994 RepID=A0A8C5YVT4_MARMA
MDSHSQQWGGGFQPLLGTTYFLPPVPSPWVTWQVHLYLAPCLSILLRAGHWAASTLLNPRIRTIEEQQRRCVCGGGRTEHAQRVHLLPERSPLSLSGGHFMSTAERIRLPDDCTIGYIVEALLGVPLIRSGLFHSHLENLQQVPASELHEQVTLSYGMFENKRNAVHVKGPFSVEADPSRWACKGCLGLGVSKQRDY